MGVMLMIGTAKGMFILEYVRQPSLNEPVREGDEIIVLQAISGGCYLAG